jgi:hypothetical protein
MGIDAADGGRPVSPICGVGGGGCCRGCSESRVGVGGTLVATRLMLSPEFMTDGSLGSAIGALSV